MIDITDPASLRIVGDADTPGIAHGVAVSPAGVYVACGTAGLQILPAQCESPTPPDPFRLQFPADAESLLTVQPKVSWRIAREADPGDTVSYTIYWSEDAGFGSSDSAAVGPDTTYTFGSSVLRAHNTYYWKARAWGTHGLAR